MQANRDATEYSVVSDLDLHYLHMSHKKDARHIWFKNAVILLISQELQKFGKYIVELIFLVAPSAKGTSL